MSQGQLLEARQQVQETTSLENALQKFEQLGEAKMKKKLIDCWGQIIKDLDITRGTLQELMRDEYRVLDESSVKRIKAMQDPEDKGDAILEKIQKNVYERLPKFVVWLCKTDQEALAKKYFLQDCFAEEGLL